MTAPTTTQTAQALADILRGKLRNLSYSDLEGVVTADTEEQEAAIADSVISLAQWATVQITSTSGGDTPVTFTFVVDSTDPVALNEPTK